MASTLEILLIDTVRLVQAIGEDDFDEARFRCESIVTRAWGNQMSKVGNAAMELAHYLHPANLGRHVGRDAALTELIAQVELQAAPLRDV